MRLYKWLEPRGSMCVSVLFAVVAVYPTMKPYTNVMDITMYVSKPSALTSLTDSLRIWDAIR